MLDTDEVRIGLVYGWQRDVLVGEKFHGDALRKAFPAVRRYCWSTLSSGRRCLVSVQGWRARCGVGHRSHHGALAGRAGSKIFVGYHLFLDSFFSDNSGWFIFMEDLILCDGSMVGSGGVFYVAVNALFVFMTFKLVYTEVVGVNLFHVAGWSIFRCGCMRNMAQKMVSGGWMRFQVDVHWHMELWRHIVDVAEFVKALSASTNSTWPWSARRTPCNRCELILLLVTVFSCRVCLRL